MRYFLFILFLFGLVTLTACKTDFDTIPSSGNLEFSEKIVYLDTIFSQISSSTYQLKVYNRSKNDINIPIIQLKNPSSKYRLMVDGRSDNLGKKFENVELLANDSLFIFIETTFNEPPSTLEFTYEDKILFDVGSNEQSVDLVTLIRDACFYKPDRSLDGKIYETINVIDFDPDTQGHVLTDADFTPNGSWTWTNLKPYVIYGNLVVPNGKTLTINKGTQVYFHNNATLIVDALATLIIKGERNDLDIEGVITTRNEVTFEGDRLEPLYENVPGQWGAVFIFSANLNKIDYLTLKNASVGLFILPKTDSASFPKLEINNSQIYDCSNFGILARQSDISGYNLVMNSAGQACLAATLGGSYDFTHCTFNNDWNSTTQVAVLLNNYYEDENRVRTGIPLTKADFKNCIIYGKNNIEVELQKINEGTAFNFLFQKCLFKFDDANSLLATNQLYDTIRNQENGNKKNIDPKFKNPDRNLMWPTENLDLIILQTISSTDILGRPRTNVGAYQFIPNL